ncbi:hypothetical protein DFA_02609 [Cavenderia fasciculata]|uniref:Uncharacterized protein n=1 Tax=Cavenderia fasciculata TaxID=261658 RepID=F4PZV6_CACFS|nr:uncharacterized protein DFA_02609 [Cavenderia fasciculata]EGG18870.1 hypothetical protein DFA_02609 [Cavenderia fasciculata]|eukprot:XP_004357332.1 hypothetical protein DFA_02609 [Cavenderia fasciculata]
MSLPSWFHVCVYRTYLVHEAAAASNPKRRSNSNLPLNHHPLLTPITPLLDSDRNRIIIVIMSQPNPFFEWILSDESEIPLPDRQGIVDSLDSQKVRSTPAANQLDDNQWERLIPILGNMGLNELTCGYSTGATRGGRFVGSHTPIRYEEHQLEQQHQQPNKKSNNNSRNKDPS